MPLTLRPSHHGSPALSWITNTLKCCKWNLLFFSLPLSEGWPHHVCTFSIYLCLLPFSVYLCLQFLISMLLLPSFPDCYKSFIRYPCLFLLRIRTSNHFSGYFKQDCLGTFPEIFCGYLILCSLQCLKPVGHLCCKLYWFLFLEFLQIQRQNALLSLSFSQPDFQRRHEQPMICVTVCTWIRATIHQTCVPSLCNWHVVYLIPGVAIRRGPGIQPPCMLF